jgi:hypothetical protein
MNLKEQEHSLESWQTQAAFNVRRLLARPVYSVMRHNEYDRSYSLWHAEQALPVYVQGCY